MDNDIRLHPPCLSVPHLMGWAALQARCVHHIKRAALRQLHASAAGERLILRVYMIGELTTEVALQSELVPTPPAWLARQMAQHLQDERYHATLFADALRARGATEAPPDALPDVLSRRKIHCWRQLALQHAPHFEAGLLVPTYAIALCAEQMAERVLQRHCALIGKQHTLSPLLEGVLADEERHVRLCRFTLGQLVRPDELDALASLVGKIRAVERSWGITGALGMYLAGVTLRVWRQR